MWTSNINGARTFQQGGGLLVMHSLAHRADTSCNISPRDCHTTGGSRRVVAEAYRATPGGRKWKEDVRQLDGLRTT